MLLCTPFPLDGSPLAKRALEIVAFPARSTALTRTADEPPVILFRAVDSSPLLDLPGGGTRTRAVEAATHHLEEQGAGPCNEEPAFEAIARIGHPAAELLDQVPAHKVDQVMISTKGQSGPVHWAFQKRSELVRCRLDSATQEVHHYGGLPVTLVPSSQAAPQLALEVQEQRAPAREAL